MRVFHALPVPKPKYENMFSCVKYWTVPCEPRQLQAERRIQTMDLTRKAKLTKTIQCEGRLSQSFLRRSFNVKGTNLLPVTLVKFCRSISQLRCCRQWKHNDVITVSSSQWRHRSFIHWSSRIKIFEPQQKKIRILETWIFFTTPREKKIGAICRKKVFKTKQKIGGVEKLLKRGQRLAAVFKKI